jgi:hypothetical protein
MRNYFDLAKSVQAITAACFLLVAICSLLVWRGSGLPIFFFLVLNLGAIGLVLLQRGHTFLLFAFS